MTDDWLIAAELAYDAGPKDRAEWTCRNPPTDVTGPPAVYEIPVRGQICLVDRWIVDLCLPEGREYAIRFLAAEAAAFEDGISLWHHQ